MFHDYACPLKNMAEKRGQKTGADPQSGNHSGALPSNRYPRLLATDPPIPPRGGCDDPGRTRTCNLRMCVGSPYPLGQRANSPLAGPKHANGECTSQKNVALGRICRLGECAGANRTPSRSKRACEGRIGPKGYLEPKWLRWHLGWTKACRQRVHFPKLRNTR